MNNLVHFHKLLKNLYNIPDDKNIDNIDNKYIKTILEHTANINNLDKQFLNTQSLKFINIDNIFYNKYNKTEKGKKLNTTLLTFQKNIILLYIEKFLDKPGCEDSINDLLIHFNEKITIATDIIEGTLHKPTINSSNSLNNQQQNNELSGNTSEQIEVPVTTEQIEQPVTTEQIEQPVTTEQIETPPTTEQNEANNAQDSSNQASTTNNIPNVGGKCIADEVNIDDISKINCHNEIIQLYDIKKKLDIRKKENKDCNKDDINAKIDKYHELRNNCKNKHPKLYNSNRNKFREFLSANKLQKYKI